MYKKAPVIIIGMHRSGTSIVTRLLEELGLFVGFEKDNNNESTYFIQLNNWLLAQAGATWDNPLPFNNLLEFPRLRDFAVKYLRDALDSDHRISYMGKKYYKKFSTIENISVPWGWKDPRNTFTLPLWLQIFPTAKIIYVVRNGIDVAQSLKVRSHKDVECCYDQWVNGKYRIKYRPNKEIRLNMIATSVRSMSLQGGLSIWSEYMQQGADLYSILKNDFKTIKYEEFMSNPIDILTDLAFFCGLNVDKNIVYKLVSEIKKERKFAYLNDPELLAFYQSNLEILSKFGY